MTSRLILHQKHRSKCCFIEPKMNQNVSSSRLTNINSDLCVHTTCILHCALLIMYFCGAWDHFAVFCIYCARGAALCAFTLICFPVLTKYSCELLEQNFEQIFAFERPCITNIDQRHGLFTQ